MFTFVLNDPKMDFVVSFGLCSFKFSIQHNWFFYSGNVNNINYIPIYTARIMGALTFFSLLYFTLHYIPWLIQYASLFSKFSFCSTVFNRHSFRVVSFHLVSYSCSYLYRLQCRRCTVRFFITFESLLSLFDNTKMPKDGKCVYQILIYYTISICMFCISASRAILNVSLSTD